MAYFETEQLAGRFEYRETEREEWTEEEGIKKGGRYTTLSRLSLSLSFSVPGQDGKAYTGRRKHVMRGDDTATETQLHPL